MMTGVYAQKDEQGGDTADPPEKGVTQNVTETGLLILLAVCIAVYAKKLPILGSVSRLIRTDGLKFPISVRIFPKI